MGAGWEAFKLFRDRDDVSWKPLGTACAQYGSHSLPCSSRTSRHSSAWLRFYSHPGQEQPPQRHALGSGNSPPTHPRDFPPALAGTSSKIDFHEESVCLLTCSRSPGEGMAEGRGLSQPGSSTSSSYKTPVSSLNGSRDHF